MDKFVGPATFFNMSHKQHAKQHNALHIERVLFAVACKRQLDSRSGGIKWWHQIAVAGKDSGNPWPSFL